MEGKGIFKFLKKNIGSLVCLFAFTIFILFFHRNGLFFNHFNVDEIVLLFTARGQLLLDANLEFSSFGTFLDSWNINRKLGGSLDPGLFTLLLRIWSILSSNTFWLRSLPYCFFLLGFYLIVFRTDQTSKTIKNGLIFFPLLYSNELIMNYAFTIRPYTMELCGFFYMFRFFQEDQKDRSSNSLFICSILMTLFLGSRYILWFVFSTFLIIDLISKYKAKNFRNLFVYVIPVLYMIFTILFVTRYQLSTLHFDYSDPFFIFGNKDKMLSNLNDPHFYLILTFPIYFLISRYWSSQSEKSLRLAIFFVVIFVVYIGLDFFRLSPFDLSQRFTITFHGASILSFFLVFQKIFEELSKKNLIMTLLLFFAFGFYKSSNFEFRPQTEILQTIHHINKNIPKDNIIFCDVITYAMISYLKTVSNFKMSWNELPKFEKIDQDSINSDLDHTNGLVLITAIQNKPEILKAISPSIVEKYELIFGARYQKLYGPKK